MQQDPGSGQPNSWTRLARKTHEQLKMWGRHPVCESGRKSYRRNTEKNAARTRQAGSLPHILKRTLNVTLLLQIIEVVTHRALVGARDLLLAESTLRIRLCGSRSRLVLDAALSFDADPF